MGKKNIGSDGKILAVSFRSPLTMNAIEKSRARRLKQQQQQQQQ